MENLKDFKNQLQKDIKNLLNTIESAERLGYEIVEIEDIETLIDKLSEYVLF